MMKKIISVLLAICLTLGCTVIAFADNFGAYQTVNNDGIVNYLFTDGKTGVEVTDESEIFWVKESAENSSVWFGFANYNNVLPKGSIVTVKLIDKYEEPGVWDYCYNLIDAETQKNADNNYYLFLCECYDASGVRYKVFADDLTVYVQLGSDWDSENIKALFVVDGPDEKISVTRVTSDGIPSAPTEGHFAKITMQHFSPYFVYDVKNSSGFPASIISGGSMGILVFSAALLVGCAVCITLLISRKKKAAASGTSAEDEE